MPTFSVVGDGQLARMMHTAAIELGLAPRVLAGSPDSSAAQVFGDVYVGDYTCLSDLQAVVHGASAVTFDHEHVPSEHLHALMNAGVAVEPRPTALIYAQDKLAQRRRLAELGLPVPQFAPIENEQQAHQFFNDVDGEVCVKATTGGYDGKGVWFPTSIREMCSLLSPERTLMAERKIPFDRELSALVARNRSGEIVAWPVVESRQENGVCAVAIAPAPQLDPQLERDCRELATSVAQQLDVTGVLAVELFCTGDEIFVNELAMRPHNTGHWTQDGCRTSQFEQHIRAVLDWPLGSVELTAPVTVMVNTLGAATDPQMPMAQRVRDVMRRYPQAKVHLYGKDYQPGRKMGHVNACGNTLAEVLAIAEDAAHYIVNARWKDGA